MIPRALWLAPCRICRFLYFLSLIPTICILSALRTFPRRAGLLGACCKQESWDTVCAQIEFSSWIRPFKWGHLIQWHCSASQMYELGGKFPFSAIFSSHGAEDMEKPKRKLFPFKSQNHRLSCFKKKIVVGEKILLANQICFRKTFSNWWRDPLVVGE